MIASAGARCAVTLMDNGARWIFADDALADAGIAHVPLPLFFSPAQRIHAIESSGADLAITDRPDEILALESGFERISEWRGSTLLARPIATPVHLPAGTAKITFTSGTTGDPKGVCLSASQMAATAAALAGALSPLKLKRHLCALPLPVLLENVAGVRAPRLAGMSVVAPPLAETGLMGAAGFDAMRFARCLEVSAADSVILLPQMLEAWLAEIEAGRLAPPKRLRFAAVGGARVSPETLIRAREAGLPVFEGYGLSECASVVSLNRPGANRTGSVGRPLPHLAVTFGDGGEILVAGPSCLGYLGETDRPADAILSTGDLGHRDNDGFLTVTGRKKNLLITGFGRNVAPEWVESELRREPAIAQAAVFGEARPWLCAVIVPRGEATGIAEAVGRVNASLPDYARVHRFIVADQPFMAANELATSNGRPRRLAIAAHYRKRLETLYEGIRP